MAPTQEGVPKSLPADAILEILTRASLEALRACRCTCWEWYRLTYHPFFTSLHCERTQTISGGYFMQCMKKARYFSSFVSMHPLPPSAQPLSLDFLPRNVKIEAVAPQGIMLCTLQEYASMIPRFYVCKPATRQWCRIPNPRTRYHTRKTAMVTCSSGGRRLEYKIVRFSEPKPSNDSKSAYDLRCEIFDSRSRAWRRSNDIRLPPYTLLRSYDAAVTANGAVHWLTYDDDIFAFNVCNESWRLIPLPESARRDEKGWPPKRVLVKREGLLCLLLVYDEWLAIWVMADYKEQIWERREVVSLEALKKKDRTSIVFDLYSPSVALACSWTPRVIWYGFFNSQVSLTFFFFLEYSIRWIFC